MSSAAPLETHMVDISAKAPTARQATARAEVLMRPETLAALLDGAVPKGDVLTIAKIAGIQGAKRCSDLIPLCHPLNLTGVEIVLEPLSERSGLEILATVKVDGRTGVEMEALTAVSTAALTVYDMCKGLDKEMVISEIYLLQKRGGKSGDFTHPRAAQTSVVQESKDV